MRTNDIWNNGMAKVRNRMKMTGPTKQQATEEAQREEPQTHNKTTWKQAESEVTQSPQPTNTNKPNEWWGNNSYKDDHTTKSTHYTKCTTNKEESTSCLLAVKEQVSDLLHKQNEFGREQMKLVKHQGKM